MAFVGVGENGHLAFNDPPADFETEQPYIVVIWMTPAASNNLEKVVPDFSRCSAARDFYEHSPDSEGEKDHVHRA